MPKKKKKKKKKVGSSMEMGLKKNVTNFTRVQFTWSDSPGGIIMAY